MGIEDINFFFQDFIPFDMMHSHLDFNVKFCTVELLNLLLALFGMLDFGLQLFNLSFPGGDIIGTSLRFSFVLLEAMFQFCNLIGRFTCIIPFG